MVSRGMTVSFGIESARRRSVPGGVEILQDMERLRIFRWISGPTKSLAALAIGLSRTCRDPLENLSGLAALFLDNEGEAHAR
jgi:hypothetical protein